VLEGDTMSEAAKNGASEERDAKGKDTKGEKMSPKGKTVYEIAPEEFVISGSTSEDCTPPLEDKVFHRDRSAKYLLYRTRVDRAELSRRPSKTRMKKAS
jgi:hypothetical protein